MTATSHFVLTASSPQCRAVASAAPRAVGRAPQANIVQTAATPGSSRRCLAL